MRIFRFMFLPALFTGAALAIAAPGARAAFDLLPGAEGFSATVANENGSPDSKAGAHPYEVKLKLQLSGGGELSDGDLRNLSLVLPPGMLVSPTVQECRWDQFNTPRTSPFQESLSGESCPDSSQIGVVAVKSSFAGGATRWFGVFNLAPPDGAPAAIGFAPFGVPVVLTAHLRESDGATVLKLENLSQLIDFQAFDITLWGTPWASPSNGWWTFQHDNERGNCLNEEDPKEPFGSPAELTVGGAGQPPTYRAGTCSVGGNPLLSNPKALLSLPTSCGTPLKWELSVESWRRESVKRELISEDSEGHPLAPTECLTPLSVAEVHLGTNSAASPASFILGLDSRDEGLYAEGRVRSTPRIASMQLPEGLTINPSVGSGLGTCSAADFAREGLATPVGAGCPNSSKIGSVAIEGLMGLSAPVKGSVFLAAPYENPFNALLGVYVTVDGPARGIFLRSQGAITPDPHTGRLAVTFTNLPQLYYTHFALTLREGQRAVMVSPPTCGEKEADLQLHPWSNPAETLHTVSYFPITQGERGGPCPGGQLAPFAPRLEAGSLNSAAGAYSPFYLHITRTDAEQEVTSYSATFPPGLLARIAGIPECPDSAIDAARAMSGTEELEHPSCPAASSIGHTVTGYGVGPVLAYAPGGLYLAGPYHGAPLSVVAVDSALVGPFDLGVVIVRSAIRIDRRTAEASIDSTGSDPIPHILHGIPLHIRDIRVFVDRPDFVVNPTNCDPMQTLSKVTGAGRDLFSAADDVPSLSMDRFQLLGCRELGFRPKLSLRLLGGMGPNKNPKLRATVTMRPGDANFKAAAVALPHAEFLAQSHIRTVCTRSLFEAHACPKGSIYGHASAFTPLLAEPMEGPVYLVSGMGHRLPDMVVPLTGPGGIEVVLDAKIDQLRGGMRATFEDLPDAPASKFVLTLFGGRRGLLVNSADVCRHPADATVRFLGQNNSGYAPIVPLAGQCKGHRKHKGRRKKGRHSHEKAGRKGKRR